MRCSLPAPSCPPLSVSFPSHDSATLRDEWRRQPWRRALNIQMTRESPLMKHQTDVFINRLPSQRSTVGFTLRDGGDFEPWCMSPAWEWQLDVSNDERWERWRLLNIHVHCRADRDCVRNSVRSRRGEAELLESAHITEQPRSKKLWALLKLWPAHLSVDLTNTWLLLPHLLLTACLPPNSAFGS